MRTLLSVNSYFYRRDGSEAVFFEHNRVFEEAGWQVVPFAMRHPENQPSPWADHFPSEIEFGHDYSMLQKLARVPKVIYSTEARDKLGRLLDQVRPGIAHLHTIYHHLSPSILDALKQRGIPTLMTLHDLKIACPAYHMMTDGVPCERCRGGRLHNVVVHRCIKDSLALSAVVMAEAVVHAWRRSYDKGVDLFVAPSRFYIDKLEEWGWPRSRFVHVPNCVPVDGVVPSFAPGSDFLYFGRLAVEKGLITLVRAAARAGVRLRMAGQGPLRSALEQEAAACGAQVEFLGQLPVDALRQAIAASRATVLASECYENAPMSVLESYAMGKPVIGSRIGGIPEIIQEGETGWLFRTGSVEHLAEVLRTAADTPDADISSMGRAARRLVEANYSSAIYRERTLALYDQLNAGRRRHA